MSQCKLLFVPVAWNLGDVFGFRSCGEFMSFSFTLLLVLQVIVPLLVTEDEKTLVTCINCLTKVLSFANPSFHCL